MTEAVIEQPQQTEEQAEADFAKGFGAAPEQSAPEQKTEEVKDDKNIEGEAQAAPEKPAEKVGEKPIDKTQDAPAESPRIAGMTEAEFSAAIRKAVGGDIDAVRAEIRKNFGQIGDLNRSFNELKAAKGSPAATRKITAELLKRVNEELPGLGNALAEDLSAIFGAAEVAQEKAEAKGQSFDQEAFFSQKIVPALQQLEARSNQAAELRIVKSIHRDFDTVVKSQEFGAWLKTLPDARQKEVRESEDGFVAADAVTEFKTARDKAKKQKETNQKRLEGAVTPRGVPASGPQPNNEDDEEAAFLKGFGKRAAR